MQKGVEMKKMCATLFLIILMGMMSVSAGPCSAGYVACRGANGTFEACYAGFEACMAELYP